MVILSADSDRAMPVVVSLPLEAAAVVHIFKSHKNNSQLSTFDSGFSGLLPASYQAAPSPGLGLIRLV